MSTRARNGDVELHVDTFGDPAYPTLLLINGLGSQCINFDERWCERFVATGLHVVRFDNRDVGLSTWFDDAPVTEHGNAYVLGDMAADAVAVLDHLGVERAHVVGFSMGGMIVQTLAIEHPERLLTATSVMSSTGEPDHGQSAPEAYAQLTAPPPEDREGFVAAQLAGAHIWGSPAFLDDDRIRAMAERAFDRAFHPAGTRRQFLAVGASGPRADGLREVTTPMLVIHGDADRLITPSGGERTAELVPGARFELVEGMGHDYPPQLWDHLVGLVASHIAAHVAG